LNRYLIALKPKTYALKSKFIRAELFYSCYEIQVVKVDRQYEFLLPVGFLITLIGLIALIVRRVRKRDIT
jgi:hypothetical protein